MRPHGPDPYVACTTAFPHALSSKSGRAKSAGNVFAAFQVASERKLSVVPSAYVTRTTTSRPAGEFGPLFVRTAMTLRVGSRAVKKRRACCHSSLGLYHEFRLPFTDSFRESVL